MGPPAALWPGSAPSFTSQARHREGNGSPKEMILLNFESMHFLQFLSKSKELKSCASHVQVMQLSEVQKISLLSSMKVRGLPTQSLESKFKFERAVRHQGGQWDQRTGSHIPGEIWQPQDLHRANTEPFWNMMKYVQYTLYTFICVCSFSKSSWTLMLHFVALVFMPSRHITS